MSANIDWSFISKQEGGQVLDGYVPYRPGSIGNSSGVTIATGFDVGQRSITELRNLLGPGPLTMKLEPYAGLKRESARHALKTHPLTVTRQEANRIDMLSKQRIVGDLIRRYDCAIAAKRSTSAGRTLLDFHDLPTEAATVIASVAFQYGVGLANATPRFWDQVTDQDWAAAHANLINFGDNYSTRRRGEAQYLSPLLNQQAPAAP